MFNVPSGGGGFQKVFRMPGGSTFVYSSSSSGAGFGGGFGIPTQRRATREE
jgi:hypothetical protein